MAILSGRCLRVCSRRSSRLFPAARPSIRIWSGRSSATFMALVPIEPVLPSTTTVFMRPADQGGSRDGRLAQNMAQIEVHQRGIEHQTVEQVEDAANAREIVAGILDARLAFEQRLDQIAHDR